MIIDLHRSYLRKITGITNVCITRIPKTCNSDGREACWIIKKYCNMHYETIGWEYKKRPNVVICWEISLWNNLKHVELVTGRVTLLWNAHLKSCVSDASGGDDGGRRWDDVVITFTSRLLVPIIIYITYTAHTFVQSIILLARRSCWSPPWSVQAKSSSVQVGYYKLSSP